MIIINVSWCGYQSTVPEDLLMVFYGAHDTGKIDRASWDEDSGLDCPLGTAFHAATDGADNGQSHTGQA